MDPDLFEPVVDPTTGEEQTFDGWVDPDYEPAPGSTPFPDCYLDEFTNARTRRARPGPSAAPGRHGRRGGRPEPRVRDQGPERAGDAAFTIAFDNQDAGQPHNIEIKDAAGAQVFKGDLITGPAKTTYNVPALAAGTLPVHLHGPPQHDRHDHGRELSDGPDGAPRPPHRAHAQARAVRPVRRRRLAVGDRQVPVLVRD